MNPKWYHYVAECSDGSFYSGVTTELRRRINEHNTSIKGSKYTRARRPVRLVYFDEHKDRSAAQKAESSFRKLNRKQKEALVSERLLSLISS